MLRHFSGLALCHLQGSRFVAYAACASTYTAVILQLKHRLHMLKSYYIPEESQQLKPKHVGALINPQITLCGKFVLNFTYVIYLHGKCTI